MYRLRIPLLVAAGAAIIAGGYTSCRPGHTDRPRPRRERLLPFHAVLEGEARAPHDEMEVAGETLTLG
jgi:hypothetical protein